MIQREPKHVDKVKTTLFGRGMDSPVKLLSLSASHQQNDQDLWEQTFWNLAKKKQSENLPMPSREFPTSFLTQSDGFLVPGRQKDRFRQPTDL